MQYSNVFRKKEILRIEKFYLFEERKKIAVYVPQSHINKLLKKMALSGAGNIGNYSECSFRTEGTGTFRPNAAAKPFSGKANKLSEETEFKFEMECNAGDLNKIICAMIRHHPYEEAAYEVYDFIKREKKSSGIIAELKQKMKADDLLKRINKNITEHNFIPGTMIKKPALISRNISKQVINSAVYAGCDCVLQRSKNNFILHLIK